MPDRRKGCLDIAYEHGKSVEIMVVHYSSDEEVARQLAHRVLLLMWYTDTFQKDLAFAPEEWN
jgi:acid phosphatase (class A)